MGGCAISSGLIARLTLRIFHDTHPYIKSTNTASARDEASHAHAPSTPVKRLAVVSFLLHICILSDWLAGPRATVQAGQAPSGAIRPIRDLFLTSFNVGFFACLLSPRFLAYSFTCFSSLFFPFSFSSLASSFRQGG